MTGSGSLRKHSLAKHDLLTQWENLQSPTTITGFSAQFGLSAGRFASDATMEAGFSGQLPMSVPTTSGVTASKSHIFFFKK